MRIGQQVLLERLNRFVDQVVEFAVNRFGYLIETLVEPLQERLVCLTFEGVRQARAVLSIVFRLFVDLVNDDR